MNNIIINRIITEVVVANVMIVELKDDSSLGDWARIRLIKLIMSFSIILLYY